MSLLGSPPAFLVRSTDHQDSLPSQSNDAPSASPPQAQSDNKPSDETGAPPSLQLKEEVCVPADWLSLRWTVCDGFISRLSDPLWREEIKRRSEDLPGFSVVIRKKKETAVEREEGDGVSNGKETASPRDGFSIFWKSNPVYLFRILQQRERKGELAKGFARAWAERLLDSHTSTLQTGRTAALPVSGAVCASSATCVQISSRHLGPVGAGTLQMVTRRCLCGCKCTAQDRCKNVCGGKKKKKRTCWRWHPSDGEEKKPRGWRDSPYQCPDNIQKSDGEMHRCGYRSLKCTSVALPTCEVVGPSHWLFIGPLTLPHWTNKELIDPSSSRAYRFWNFIHDWLFPSDNHADPSNSSSSSSSSGSGCRAKKTKSVAEEVGVTSELQSVEAKWLVLNVGTFETGNSDCHAHVHADYESLCRWWESEDLQELRAILMQSELQRD
uniref:Uncharacterized protein n=1 Tax=Chromera velia CCMP2878 TaxID=1169474 RepID=A0A0G4HB67_9ALVE|eukprot:Cvel_6167.t1-p1 / transcript=Cvel_6167.t1 / gene=Cvel_6167 / organism=Chromera_velia_CCMP2878 / gene_product=hypothetical protein / transcript_product=hypothetical protein / location=Cvel_scaffold298:82764-84464(-) / protein_length=438 / sequence_SO=supercontig / SO=protein_coding / is_pseudo=false